MGEAKRRRLNDPTYGRAPKDAKRRGLVICPPITIEGQVLKIRSTNLDPQELRFALLFWDHLVWPSSRAIYIPSGPDELFLESTGVLTRPDYTWGGSGTEILVKAQVQAYQDLEKKEPGCWALAQGESTLWLKEGFAEQEGGASLELHRAIPLPQHDVPLAEILEFKQRRRDELFVLRHHIESFVTEIEGSPDRASALEQRVSEIDRACVDLLTVGKEWQFPVYLSDMKATFSLTPTKFLPAIAAGWVLGKPFGLTAATSAAALFGAGSTLEIKGDIRLRSVKHSSPYRYAQQIHQELR